MGDVVATGDGIIRGITQSDFFNTVAEFKDKSYAVLGDQAWHLWQQKKWQELEALFKANNLNGGWPPNRGFVDITTESLSVGTTIDRYGGYIRPAGK